MSDNILLADLLLPNIDKTPDYYEKLYPARNLPEGARVVRVAPSPTGYLHLGTLFAGVVNRITATSSGGVFFTRIEDTDKEREIEGGIENIVDEIMPMYIQAVIYGIILDAKISEHSSRMNSMKNATDNADEVIDKLQILYNRARQSAITTELIDIISGANAVE